MRSREACLAPPLPNRSWWLRQWWLNRPLRAKGLIVVAVPLVALIGTTSASLALTHDESQERSVARVGRNLSSAAGVVLADAVNAETGVRGYGMTGDALFLAPYNLALTRIGAERKSLRDAAVTEGDSGQQRVVDATTGKVLAELAQLRSAIAAGMPGRGLRPAVENEKTTMDLLRRQIASLASGPTALEAPRSSQIARLQNTITILDVAALLLGLLAGLAGVALFTSGIARRVTANAANADRLGEGQPLEPRPHAGDEIGRLSKAHVRAEKLLASRSAELTAARDEALKATQAKNAFLSSTSHELRTPLNSILGFTQLLLLSDLSGENQDGAERILGAGRHLLVLINELIDIARIESGDLSLSLEPVWVLPLVTEISQLMGPLAAERSITIVRQCAGPALAAHGDRQRFSQVLVNLMSNAVKYNRHGGTITITCQEEGTSQVSVVVADTGQGLSPDDIDRVFVPFERLGAEQTATEGTGIGLPLAKALTEAMGGRLSASSVLGEGSAFTITLPRAQGVVDVPPPRAASAPPARPPALAGATMSILYIEDNPANIEVVSRFLKSRQDTVLQAVSSGRAGIECAIRDVPDLILLDLHLQDLHGNQVLKELRAEPVTAAIPVVVLSADATPGVIRRLLAGGALAFLTKPLDLTEFGEMLDSFATPAQDRRARAALRKSPACTPPPRPYGRKRPAR
jgi:signal transduction histidine kinase/AmiR/NasT family two-component response regulator